MDYTLDNCNNRVCANTLIKQSEFGNNNGKFSMTIYFKDSFGKYYFNDVSLVYCIEIEQFQSDKGTFTNFTDHISIPNCNFVNYYNQKAFYALEDMYGVFWFSILLHISKNQHRKENNCEIYIMEQSELYLNYSTDSSIVDLNIVDFDQVINAENLIVYMLRKRVLLTVLQIKITHTLFNIKTSNLFEFENVCFQVE